MPVRIGPITAPVALPAERMPSTSSIRNFEEPGSTSPQTLLTMTSMNPAPSMTRRGLTNPQIIGHTALRDTGFLPEWPDLPDLSELRGVTAVALLALMWGRSP